MINKQYLIWQCNRGWRVSRLDGRIDEHTAKATKLLIGQSDGTESAWWYFQTSGLAVEVHPLDTEPAALNLVDTFMFTKQEYRRVN